MGFILCWLGFHRFRSNQRGEFRCCRCDLWQSSVIYGDDFLTPNPES